MSSPPAAVGPRFGAPSSSSTPERLPILVSHRLGFARLCDRVLVLRAGELIEQGTHDALLAAEGEYARMWAAQAQWYR